MRVDGFLRLKHFVVTRWRILAVTVLILSVACLVVSSVSHDGVPTKTVEEKEDTMTAKMDVETGTVVTGNSTLYRSGRSLRNMPVYPTSVSSNLTVSLRTRVPEAEVVSQSLSLVYRVSHSSEVFWDRSRTLAREETTATDGEATVTGVIDISEVQDRKEEIGSEVGGAGTVGAFIAANTTYTTERYEGVLSDEAELRMDDSSYSLAGNLSGSREHATTVKRRTIDEEGVVALRLSGETWRLSKGTAFFGGVGFVALLLAILVVVYAKVGKGTEEIRRKIDRRRYSEWISVGELPSRDGRRVVEMASLEDLVDVGIDSSKRTIQDTESGEYGVIDDGVIYYYGEVSEGENDEVAEGDGKDEGISNGQEKDSTGEKEQQNP